MELQIKRYDFSKINIFSGISEKQRKRKKRVIPRMS
jgi:hypothetical protein